MLCDSENGDVSATRLSARVVSFAESCFRKAPASAKSEGIYAPVFDDDSDDEVADEEEAEVVEKQRRFQQRLESRL